MHRFRTVVALGASLAILLGACGSDDSGSADGTTTTSAGEPDVSTTEGSQSEPPAGDFEDLSSAVFDDPTTVDNPYFPLVPGTKHVYEGQAMEGDEVVDRKIVYIVTDLTKEINGVETVVIWERDFNDDELAESEIAFFAQDNDGNVWHFGQYRETYEDDEFVGGRIWLNDLPAGALAGIVMPGDPKAGSSYSQGFAPPPFNWTDRMTIGKVGVETCNGDECFPDTLVVEESDSEHVGAVQLKYYARDVGGVKVGFTGPDPEEEELALVEDVKLEGAGLDEVRAAALAHEERGYMYGTTNAAKRRG